MKTIYRAFDGTEFDNAKACEEHEKRNPLISQKHKEALLLVSELKATGLASIARNKGSADGLAIAHVAAVDLVRMYNAYADLTHELAKLINKNGG